MGSPSPARARPGEGQAACRSDDPDEAGVCAAQSVRKRKQFPYFLEKICSNEEISILSR